MIPRNVIFTSDDPWFNRITSRNKIASDMQKASKLLGDVNGYSTNKFVYNMCHNLQSNKELYKELDKHSFAVLLFLIKDVVKDDVYTRFNGLWFEKLLSRDGLPEADLTFEAKVLLAETFYHNIMLMWFDNDYELHKVQAVKYTTYYWEGYCTNASCRTMWPTYYWVFYKVKSSLILKGELKQGKLREIPSVEVGQLFNTVYGYHLNSLLSRITNFNEFTFSELPPLDLDELHKSSEMITRVAEELTEEMKVVNANVRQVNTLLTSSNFSTKAIDKQIGEVNTDLTSNSTAEFNSIKENVKKHSDNTDGREGSLLDFLSQNTTSTIKGVAMQGKFIWDSVKDVVGYVKNRKSGAKFNCSICKAITARSLIKVTASSFMTGVIAGYAVNKYEKFKNSPKTFELEEKRLIEGKYYVDDNTIDYGRKEISE